MADPHRQPSLVSDVPPLVGRDRELVTLRDALAAALSGHGSLVLIGGEAGIGKTALAETLLAEAASRGAFILIGRCYDLSETPPYGPWSEALVRAPRGDALPASPDLTGDAAQNQAMLFAAVREYLGALATHQPLVLLQDDLHWANPASLDLLRTLARQLADLPLLLLATYRDDEVTGDHPLAILLPALVRESRAVRIDLRPLGETAIGALLMARYALDDNDQARLVGYLAARTEGNALFLGELLRTLEGEGVLRRDGGRWAIGDLKQAPIPMLLRQVIDRRAARLDPETRRLLTVAAVIGQTVPLSIWATVAEVEEDALLDHAERAIEARLLTETPEGEGVRFAHALIREAHYAGVPALRRRGLHHRAGEALLAARAPDPDAVAYHFQRAGDPRAVEWLVRAGERAQRAYAWLTAADRFRVAVELMDGPEYDAGERNWLLFRLAGLLKLGDTLAGLRVLEEAQTMATVRADHALAACILFTRGVLRGHSRERDLRGAMVDMAAGLAAFEALPADALTKLAGIRSDWLLEAVPSGARDAPAGAGFVDMYRGLFVLWLGGVGRHDEALAIGGGVVARTADAQPSDLLAYTAYGDVHFGLGFVHAARGQPDAARAAFQQSRQYLWVLIHYEAVASVINRELDWVVLIYQTDRLADRRALEAQAADALARSLGTKGDRADQAPQLPFLVLEGRWDEARAAAAQGVGGPYHKHWHGVLAYAQGDKGLVRQLVLETLPDGPATEPGDAHLIPALALQRLAATLALDASNLPLARDWLAAHDRWLDWSGATLGRAESALGWAAYHRAAGDAAEARRLAERGLVEASEPRQPLALLAAHRLLGELDTADSRHTDAVAHLDAALALAEACAAPYERALTLLARVELGIASGPRDAAQAALVESRGILEPLQAAPALARVAALADRLDAPAPVAAASDALPFGLTAREADVLRLLAEGLTDPQIAERLFVSRNTVNSHLRAIYGKLGVNTRTAAARLASEHGLA